MKVVIDPSLTGKELYTFLKANKAALIAQKKYEVKRGDALVTPVCCLLIKAKR
jgi:hypothetical protein